MKHVLRYCRHCNASLTVADLRYGPGDECHACANHNLRNNTVAQLKRGHYQSGRTRKCQD